MLLVANLRQILADRLAHHRKLLGWTQHDLAAESGIKVQALRNYEQQRRWPDPEEIERLARALGVQPSDLLVGEKPSSSNEDSFSVLRSILATLTTLNERELRALMRALSAIKEGIGGIDPAKVLEGVERGKKSS